MKKKKIILVPHFDIYDPKTIKNKRPKRACIALLVYTHGSKYRGIYPDCLSQAIDINEIWKQL